MRIAGVDGAKNGWVAVVVDDNRYQSARALYTHDLQMLIEANNIDLALVDIPMGLGDAEHPRLADQAARDFLKGKAASVFNSPARKAAYAEDYWDACELNRAEYDKSLSKQTWAIVPKIREADGAVAALSQERIKEGHPEVSFSVHKGEIMLSRKKSYEGEQERRDVLARIGFDVDALASALPEMKHVANDDLWDAAILAWSAERVSKSAHQSFPEDPTTDGKGLTMAILA